jgi:hypothetical protein
MGGAAAAGVLSVALDLPGMRWVGALAVAALGACAARVAARDDAWAGRAAWALALGVLAIGALASGAGVRGAYHAGVARDLRLRGRVEEARAAESRAAPFQAPWGAPWRTESD